ncbi:DUF3857 domain-containing protein [Telluribacter sp. SYSU D00476]|uniref:DUF3857 domain-containing protein n=1 Tax=Telluribacter sp. SYSU D00476 TaxID=2811430 RepID=UPI001FF2C1EA|nr:DUF3857 domain-containing protein [Telluribacter sp. SYSU D00476]
MRFYLFILLVLITGWVARAQNYSAFSIPTALTINAHAVVRYQDTEFHVKSAGEAVTRVNGAVTVLDEKGEVYATLAIPYSKFIRITDMEAQLYDASGQRVKRLKRSDIESFGTNSGSNTIDDSYIKAAVLKHTHYPYTVAYSYEYTTRNMMFYPTWKAYPYTLEGTSVVRSSFVVSMPAGLALRYREQHMPQPAVQSDKDGRKLYRWEVANLRPFETEPYAPNVELSLPIVYTGPTDFEVEQYKGKLTSWKDVGTFYRELNRDRQALPPALVTAIQEQTKALASPVQKAQKIYEYLQANTRYVSIQLGIGGWQSMRAEEVAAKGYGDCKGLTTYMGAMLQAAGIRSYPALVRAGEDEDEIRADFPSFQFNHVILCVPAARDTLWIECTSQTNPFGYLGSFTSDRQVLLITEEGGKLVRTPTYQPTDNLQQRQALVRLAENGEATVTMNTLYTGLQHDERAAVMHALGTEDQKKWILKSLSLPSVEIRSFELKESRKGLPIVEENLNLFVRNACTRSGTRLFLIPNQLNQVRSAPVPNASRKFEFEQSLHYADVDSIQFEIPEGYAPEYLPEPTRIESAFGSYESLVRQSGSTLTYVRRVVMRKGRYPAANYNAWVDFRKKMAKADKNQIVLVKK